MATPGQTTVNTKVAIERALCAIRAIATPCSDVEQTKPHADVFARDFARPHRTVTAPFRGTLFRSAAVSAGVSILSRESTAPRGTRGLGASKQVWLETEDQAIKRLFDRLFPRNPVIFWQSVWSAARSVTLSAASSPGRPPPIRQRRCSPCDRSRRRAGR
jgi:hypothetical protein